MLEFLGVDLNLYRVVFAALVIGLLVTQHFVRARTKRLKLESNLPRLSMKERITKLGRLLTRSTKDKDISLLAARRRPRGEFVEPPVPPTLGIPPEVLYVLQCVKVFGHFDEPIFLKIYNKSYTMDLEAGENLFVVGDPDDALYVVLKGTMDLYVTEGGVTHKFSTIGVSGTISSLLSVLEVMGGRRSNFQTLSARAVVPSTVIRIPTKAFVDIFENNPVLFNRMIQMILVKLKRVNFLTLRQFFGISSGLVRLAVAPTKEMEAIGAAATVSDADALDLFASAIGYTFGRVNNESKDAFMRNLPIDEVAEGDTLLTDQVSHPELIFLVSGRALAYTLSGGQRVPRYESHPGEIMGQMAVLTGLPSTVGVVMTAPGRIIRLSRKDFEAIAETCPSVLLQTSCQLIRRISPVVRQVDFVMEWKELGAGEVLYRQGEPADCIYIVLNGRLRSTVRDENSKVLGTDEYGRGVALGEVEVLTNSNRISSVLAIRDTEVARIPRAAFDWLRLKFPEVSQHFMEVMGRRILHDRLKGVSVRHGSGTQRPSKTSNKSSSKSIATVAVVAAGPDVALASFCSCLVTALQRFGSAKHMHRDIVVAELGPTCLEHSERYRMIDHLAGVEERHDVVVYEADYEATPWSMRCILHADLVLIIGRGGATPTLGPVENFMEAQGISGRVHQELILLHDALTVSHPSGTGAWLAARERLTSHFHVRMSRDQLCPTHGRDAGKVEALPVALPGEALNYDRRVVLPTEPTSDFARVARHLTGRSVGVALGGGGARGLSHIGILQAMEESGLPIDEVAGTSMGAFVAAIYADETRVDAVMRRCTPWCVDMSSLWTKIFDLTWPVTATLTGRSFNRCIFDALGERQIEDLWLPFVCVSVDMNECVLREHDRGSLWRYVRASMSLSGFLPPICDPLDGHLLMDGGYINNCPADVLQERGSSTVFAVDVGSEFDKDLTNYGDSVSGFWVLWHRYWPWAHPVNVPDLAGLQERLAYASAVIQLEKLKANEAFVYVRPPIEGFKTMEFHRILEIAASGHRFGIEEVEKWRLRYDTVLQPLAGGRAVESDGLGKIMSAMSSDNLAALDTQPATPQVVVQVSPQTLSQSALRRRTVASPSP